GPDARPARRRRRPAPGGDVLRGRKPLTPSPAAAPGGPGGILQPPAHLGGRVGDLRRPSRPRLGTGYVPARVWTEADDRLLAGGVGSDPRPRPQRGDSRAGH